MVIANFIIVHVNTLNFVKKGAKMKEAITALLDLKSIISLATTGVFVYIAVTGKMDIKDTGALIMMVYIWFFNKKEQSK
jgi:hypothetical protein